MLNLRLSAAGGAAGTLARYGTSLALARAGHRAGFPFGTFAVNLLGCLLIGYLSGAFLERIAVRPEYRAMLLVGFLGGFTTFSTFGWEVASMLREQQFARAIAYLLLSNVAGVALVVCGYAWGRA
jgi:CrcB protein